MSEVLTVRIPATTVRIPTEWQKHNIFLEDKSHIVVSDLLHRLTVVILLFSIE